MYPNLIYCIDISKIRQINDIFVGTERILILFSILKLYISLLEQRERNEEKTSERKRRNTLHTFLESLFFSAYRMPTCVQPL
jgi:hypothetical protein